MCDATVFRKILDHVVIFSVLSYVYSRVISPYVRTVTSISAIQHIETPSLKI